MFKLFLLLNPLYVTFFWAIILNISKTSQNHPRAFLGKFMIVSFVLYTSHMLYFLPKPDTYIYIDCFYQYCSLLAYPMYYIYVRLITVDKEFVLKKHGKYLLTPSILFIFYSAGALAMNKADFANFLYAKLPKEILTQPLFIYQKIIHSIMRIAFLLQVFVYLWFAMRLITKNKPTIKNYYSNLTEGSLTKIYLLTISIAISAITGITLGALGKEAFLQNPQWLLAPSIIFSSMLFLVGWLGNRQRPLLTEGTESPEEQQPESINAPSQLNTTINILFEQKKIYLNKDLTLWDVARMAGTNRTYISNMINTQYRQNFCSFVNNYRVEHAKTLLHENPGYDNNEVAEMAGFGSVDSLIRSFKQKENISLHNYRKNINGITRQQQENPSPVKSKKEPLEIEM